MAYKGPIDLGESLEVLSKGEVGDPDETAWL